MSKKPFLELSVDEQKGFVERLGNAVCSVSNDLPGDSKYVIIMRTEAEAGSQADATLIYFSNEKDPLEVKNMLYAIHRGISQYSNDRN